MENIKKPIRMCVVCRKRFFQNELIRMQCINNELIPFTGSGRSFYVCKECVKSHKFIKYVSRICNIDKEKAKFSIFHFPF